MSKTRSVYLDTRSLYCVIEQVSFILPFMYLAVVLRKMFLLIDQPLLWLRQPVLFAPALRANLDPVRKTFQSTQLQKNLSVPLASGFHAKTHLNVKVAFLTTLRVT